MRCLRVRVVTGHSGGSEDQPGDTTVVPRNLVEQGLGLVLAWSEVSKAPWSWQSRVERREAGRVLRQRTRVRVASADRLLNLPAGLGAPIPFGSFIGVFLSLQVSTQVSICIALSRFWIHICIQQSSPVFTRRRNIGGNTRAKHQWLPKSDHHRWSTDLQGCGCRSASARTGCASPKA